MCVFCGSLCPTFFYYVSVTFCLASGAGGLGRVTGLIPPRPLHTLPFPSGLLLHLRPIRSGKRLAPNPSNCFLILPLALTGLFDAVARSRTGGGGAEKGGGRGQEEKKEEVEKPARTRDVWCSGTRCLRHVFRVRVTVMFPSLSPRARVRVPARGMRHRFPNLFTHLASACPSPYCAPCHLSCCAPFPFWTSQQPATPPTRQGKRQGQPERAWRREAAIIC